MWRPNTHPSMCISSILPARGLDWIGLDWIIHVWHSVMSTGQLVDRMDPTVARVSVQPDLDLAVRKQVVGLHSGIIL